jgi:hypothetical protein
MVNNQSVAVFVEQKSGPAKAYAQNIVDGEVVLSQNELDAAVDLTFLNPFSQQINTTGTGVDILSVQVFDAQGRQIFNSTQLSELLQNDVSHWASGLYYIKVTGGDLSQKTYRLIKE